MALLAKILRWFFAVNAVLFGSVAAIFVLTTPLALWRGVYSSRFAADLIMGSPAWWVMIIPRFLLIALVAVIFGMAWWTLGKGTKWAQAWAIAASVALLPSVLIQPMLRIWTGAGILGLIVFCQRRYVIKPAAKPAKEARIAGDGTSNVLDWVADALMLAGAIVGASFWSKWGRGQGLRQDSLLEGLVWIGIASLISTAIHELGHAVTAIALDMKIRKFLCGPFEWQLLKGKWQCRFSAANLLSGRGAVGLVPASIEEYRWRSLAVTAAGPLASFVLGVSALWATLDAPDLPWQPYWKLFSYLSTFSLLGFVFNLIPMRPEAHYSDGARIYQLLAGGPASKVQHAFAMISSSEVSPLRPRDMDVHLIRHAAGFCRGQQALLLRLHACTCFIDAGKVPEAIELLADAEAVYADSLAAIPATLRAVAHDYFTYANAFLRRDAVAARMWWDRTSGRSADRFTVDSWIGYSSLLWIENRLPEARAAWARGNALAQERPAAGAYDLDRDCFARLRTELEAVAA